MDDFRRMADRIGADPARTADLVAETVSRLRDAWRAGMVDEATRRFPPLAEHYSHRLESLPICRHAD
ncbi:hypothetical protein [Micromonospora sp. WMMD712]|uniref:hypothetical protein n=1 Tax=Micromonospora sp. WMMD712 TaxID=3016096 RepID=UPI00249C516C|nr:hypothetical protein [Micromonospora sp. WMMD712]WFE60664.1 hypothetical protein O7633_29175 [Micromonospora sp. WMMD712]